MQRSSHLLALALGVAACAILLPLWAPLVLAAWTADLVRPLVRQIERRIGGGRPAAGAISVVVVLATAAPLVAGAMIAAIRARSLVAAALAEFASGKRLEEILTVGGGQGSTTWAIDRGAAIDLMREHGATLWRVLGGVLGASATAIAGVIVFAVALYSFTVDGWRLYGWLARSLPIERRVLARLGAAFRETGRGLLIGAGGTALAQSLAATLVYLSLGVQSPVALGVLTGALSFVPVVGTALVWVPVAAALGFGGHPVRAAILVALGVGFIGTIDNVLRPWLARAGRLRLPVVIVFVSMLGGLQLLGGWGVLLGPLAVRLAVEALAVARERQRITGSSR